VWWKTSLESSPEGLPITVCPWILNPLFGAALVEAYVFPMLTLLFSLTLNPSTPLVAMLRLSVAELNIPVFGSEFHEKAGVPAAPA